MTERHMWTAAETAFLIKTHRLLTASEQAQWLGLPRRSVYNKVFDLREQGRIAPGSVWQPAEQMHALIMIDAGMCVSTIARRLDRPLRGVCVKLRREGVSLQQHLARCDGLSAADLMAQLGITRRSLLRHVKSGRLKATSRRIIERRVYSFAPDDVIAFIEQHGGYVPLSPDEDWAPLVEEARARFSALYIGRTELSQLPTFPRPVHFGRRAYYERAAVEEGGERRA